MTVWDDLPVFPRLIPTGTSLCVFLVALLGAGDGHATQVRVDFSGVATYHGSDSDSELPLLPAPYPGERFEGGFAFRTEDVLSLVSEESYPYEALAGATLELSFGGVAWFPSPTVVVGDDYGPTEDTCLGT